MLSTTNSAFSTASACVRACVDGVSATFASAARICVRAGCAREHHVGEGGIGCTLVYEVIDANAV